MGRPSIPKSEFYDRTEKLKVAMREEGIDVAFVYGDEYRKENLRYIANYWPLFERGAAVISLDKPPVLLCAPEGEIAARETTVIDDVRLVPDFFCVTVPDEIEYPLATYTSFGELAKELGGCRKLGIAGMDAMPAALLESVSAAFGAPVADLNPILFKLRRLKSENEIACLMEAARIADIGYRALMEAAVPGNTELMATGAGEGAARAAGAEAVIFVVMGTGERSATIIGRPTQKVIEDGDMVMAAMAIQYEGYVASVEFPFVAGKASAESMRVIDTLVRAELAGLPYLKPGLKMKEFVSGVQGHFKACGLAEYDVYPPLHGCGCAEAESPYPNNTTEEIFEPGMTVNTDISLFGLKGGSNRIEEGYVITNDGAVPMSPLVRELCEKHLAQNG